jgi:hypothetical protein
MKKHILMVAVAASLIVVGCGDSADDETVTVTVTGPANVRDAAAVEGSAVLETLSAGTELTGHWVQNQTNPSERWFEFERDGKKVFVWERNLAIKSDTIKSNDYKSSSQEKSDEFKNAEAKLVRYRKLTNHLNMENIAPPEGDPFKQSVAILTDCTDSLYFFISLGQEKTGTSKEDFKLIEDSFSFWDAKFNEVLEQSKNYSNWKERLDYFTLTSSASNARLSNYANSPECSSLEEMDEASCRFTAWVGLKSRQCTDNFLTAGPP